MYGEVSTFSDDARDRLLATIRRALVADGVFVFDLSTPVLERAGFAVEHTWAGLEGGPYDGGEWLGVLARSVRSPGR